MKKKAASLVVFLVLFSLLSVSANIGNADSGEKYYIRANGTVEPYTELIQRDEEVYTLKGDIEGTIVVERSNVTVDGGGYTLHGPGPAEPGSVRYSYGVMMENVVYVTVKNFLVDSYDFGIWQEDCTNNVITENTIINSSIRGVYLRGDSFSNIVSNNVITTADRGIALDPNGENTISENTITNTTYAISVASSHNNVLVGNVLANNSFGMCIISASNNKLRSNTMIDNEQNLVISISGSYSSHDLLNYVQDIDTSNTINGKPIYYWVGVRDRAVPADAAFVALVNCINVTVENLSFSHNEAGILLVNTFSSTIANNVISASSTGIRLESLSINNNIHGNRITNCSNGIYCYEASNNSIYDNQIVGNEKGLYLESSYDSTFRDNIIKENTEIAVSLVQSFSNCFSENTITDNGAGINSMGTDGKNNVVSGNTLENNEAYGIRIEGFQRSVSGTEITENLITNSTCGIIIDDRSQVSVTDNTIAKNDEGLRLIESSNVVLKRNMLIDNNQTIRIEGENIQSFSHDIDTSNTVNGKPIYYWQNVKYTTVPLDAGYVALVGCSNVTVKDLLLTNSFQGILLAYTDNSAVCYNTFSGNFANGIKLWESDNNTITGNTVTSNSGWGIQLSKSSGNIVDENSVVGTINGILVQESTNNRIDKNGVSGNSGCGIKLHGSSGNSVTENSVTSNGRGIELEGSTDNTFRKNVMNQNNAGIYIVDNCYVNDMDESNTVNGKPVCYWVGVKDATVPVDSGFVALVNCTNITVQHMELSSNSHGILLAFTTDSMVALNSFTGNSAVGVGIYQSSRNTVSENYIVQNGWGIEVGDSVENEIIGNTITENNGWGIRFTGSQKDNIIYHNNFVNNKVTEGLQVSIDKRDGLGLGNVWDNGSEGNYWSDYATRYPNATQIEGTQIGNTVFYINENNQDNYPMLTQTVIPEFSSTALVVILLTLVSIGLVTYKRKLTKN